MYINSINKAKAVSIDALEGVKNTTIRWLLPPEIGVPNFEMRYFEIKKGGHTPPQEICPFEEEAFVIKGKGILKEKDGEKLIKAGDAIFIASNEAHQFLNVEEEILGFICVIPKGAEDELFKELKPKDLIKR